jgi:hypothetical protein
MLMETEDENPRYDLELYRQGLRYSGRAVRTCTQGMIDTVWSISLTQDTVHEYDLPSWLMVVLVLCDQFD